MEKPNWHSANLPEKCWEHTSTIINQVICFFSSTWFQTSTSLNQPHFRSVVHSISDLRGTAIEQIGRFPTIYSTYCTQYTGVIVCHSHVSKNRLNIDIDCNDTELDWGITSVDSDQAQKVLSSNHGHQLRCGSGLHLWIFMTLRPRIVSILYQFLSISVQDFVMLLFNAGDCRSGSNAHARTPTLPIRAMKS